MQYVRSLIFTALFFAWTFVYAIFFVLVTWTLPFRGRFALARFWAHVTLLALKWICGLDYRIEGREHLPDRAQVVLMKHSSAWETVAQTVLLPPHVWVLKRELLWIPVVGWGIQRLRAIAINRGAVQRAVRDVVSQGRRRLAAGLWVVIFPEGTRVPVGQTRRYGASGAMLAAEAGVGIVPVAHDAGRYWARRGLLKKRGIIRVVIGPPIATAGRSPRDINEEAQQWIEANSSSPSVQSSQ
jgi:1-acyl-sn-glycerol-3-phosphate acyltransferase